MIFPTNTEHSAVSLTQLISSCLFDLESMFKVKVGIMPTICSEVTRWRYWQFVGRAIHRSRVRVLAGHHSVVALHRLVK